MAQAVDLNLRLMKWRLWPSLDTDGLSYTRCLLLGAGTLGCAVARALLGWGVRDITLVDNGRVSYSNPARQCLFEFEDAEARSFKAVAAAARLRKIFPNVRSEGVVLSIPMPGHPLNLTPQTTGEGQLSEDEVQYCRLDELIRSHDVCFALTDSREARYAALFHLFFFSDLQLIIFICVTCYIQMAAYRHVRSVRQAVDQHGPGF